MELLDRRRRELDILAHCIWREVERFVPDEYSRDAFNAIYGAFVRNGALITTDAERERFGLESRDNQGWTFSERVKEDMLRTEAMQMLAAGVFAFKDGGLE